MKHIGPVRFILKGDADLAMSYTGRARLLLQQARDRMGPDKAYWTRTLPDGTEIVVSSLGGVNQVWITTSAGDVEDAPRGYMIVTKDGGESDQYLPMFGGYNELLDRDYVTGPNEWTNSNLVISASPNIYRRNRETEVAHNAIYAFPNGDNIFSLDGSYNIYNEDTIVNSDLTLETNVKKVVASYDGSNIAILKTVGDQVSNLTSIKTYSVGDLEEGSLSLTDTGSVGVTLPTPSVFTSRNPPMVSDTEIDGYVWGVTKVMGGCSYGATTEYYLYTEFDESHSNKNMAVTACTVVTDIEYISESEVGTAGVVDTKFWTTFSNIENYSHEIVNSSPISSDTSSPIPPEAIALCDTNPDAPAGTKLAEITPVSNTIIDRSDTTGTANLLAKVKVGNLQLIAYEEQGIETTTNIGYDGDPPQTTFLDWRSTITARAAIAWSIRNSTVIYLETFYDYDYFNLSWGVNVPYINRVVVESPISRTVLWEDTEMVSDRFVYSANYDLGGSLSSEERLKRQAIGFFEDYATFSRINADALTSIYADRHTDASSDVIVIDLTIDGMDDFRYAHDCTGKGANKRMQDILDDDNFQAFTAI